jgi:hypothetical protein
MFDRDVSMEVLDAIMGEVVDMWDRKGGPIHRPVIPMECE